MNVLSLFNGMGCAWLALDEAGIKVNKRYSSEIEKYPNQANDLLYPDTIQLGDVRNVDVSKLEKIDFLCAGSPCQSFSFAGKRKGMSTVDNIEILTLNHYLELKEQNFEFEGQSYLFWEFIRILTEIRKYNPDVKFLLENVIMGSKWQKVITQAIGINPIRINSSLVSAQNRKRLYWTNIAAEPDGLFGNLVCKIPQPKDKGILLKDILETDVDEKYFISDTMINRIKRTNNGERCFTTADKALCLAAGYHKQGRDNQYIVASRGRNPENPKSRESGLNTEQMLEPRYDGKTNCLTSVQKDNYVVFGEGYEQDNRAYFENGKSGTLDVKQGRQKVLLEKSPCLHGFEHGTNGQLNKQLVRGGMIRRLTPRECGRLQTVPEDKLELLINSGISDTQLYRAFGNGWTIDVIAHIVQYLKL